MDNIELPKIGKSHIVGHRKASVLKADGVWLQMIVINSAWENHYHLILEDVEAKFFMTKSVHRLVTKEELLVELGNDEQLLENLLKRD